MDEQQFEEMYQKSLSLLDAYIATQQTDAQIADAKHHKHHVEINKQYYKARAISGETFYLCKICGAIESATFSEPIRSRLIENGTCFHCNHWQQIANTNNKGRLVINGQIYSDGGNSPNSRRDFLGFGGYKWKIERDGVKWGTNNLWSGGTIPNEYRRLLPDNAKFIKEQPCND